MKILNALNKIKDHFPDTSPDYLLERLFTFPEYEWFEPNNGGGHNDYSICQELFEHRLIARMSIPLITNDGRVQGSRQFFYYSKDLQFDKKPILLQPLTLF